MMNPGPIRLVPLSACFALGLAIGGCVGASALDETAPVAAGPLTAEEAARAQAVAEMRARAAAAEAGPYPDVFANPVAQEPEPLPMDEVAAVQLELSAAGQRQSAAAPAGESAAARARALELRRLALLRAEQAERAIRGSGAGQ